MYEDIIEKLNNECEIRNLSPRTSFMYEFHTKKFLEWINDKPLSELVAELPVYYQEKLKVECPDDLKQEVMGKIADEIKETTDFELDTTDGVKILKDDGWVIIRPSGTEPIFRCFAESDSQDKKN